MSSCADFSCICSPSGSCVFATSASWPTADAPLRYRSAFSYSLRYQRRRPVKTVQPPMVRKIFGAVLNVLAPWSSSNGSLPLKSSSVLHLFRSALPHENTIDITNVLGVSAPAALLHLLGQQISPSRFSRSSKVSKLASPTTVPLPISSAVLRRADPAHLRTAPPIHSIPIGPASAATTRGFVQTALSQARRSITLADASLNARLR